MRTQSDSICFWTGSRFEIKTTNQGTFSTSSRSEEAAFYIGGGRAAQTKEMLKSTTLPVLWRNIIANRVVPWLDWKHAHVFCNDDQKRRIVIKKEFFDQKRKHEEIYMNKMKSICDTLARRLDRLEQPMVFDRKGSH